MGSYTSPHLRFYNRSLPKEKPQESDRDRPAKLTYCSNPALINKTVQYAWSSLSGTADARALASTSVDQRYFKLSAYELNAS